MTARMLLDCDPGIDDALAIALAAGHPEIDFAGITTVSGNVSLDLTTHNALKLRDFLGLACPVAAGSVKPLTREAVLAAHVHGQNGLGRARLPEPTGQLDHTPAARFLIETIRHNPGQITLVAIGPLTNIALALSLDPGIADLVRDFVIMGGAAAVPGNVTPAAEFNVGVDPEAAKIVFEAGWTVTMVGLDATRESAAEPAQLEAMRPFGRLSDELLLPCLTFQGQEDGGLYIHDACAVAQVITDQILTLTPARVDIEVDGRFTAGMTVTDFRADPRTHNTQVAVTADAEKLWTLLADTYARLQGAVERTSDH